MNKATQNTLLTLLMIPIIILSFFWLLTKWVWWINNVLDTAIGKLFGIGNDKILGFSKRE